MILKHFLVRWRKLRHFASQRLRSLGHASGAILGLCAIAVLWGGILHSLSVERDQALQGAAQNTANLARAFEEHIVRSIKAVDQTLLYVRDSYEKDPTGFDIQAWARNVQFLPDLTFQISFIDKNGIFLGSNLSSGERVNLSDREHFRVQRDSPRDDLFISKPVLGRVSQKWSIQMTRKMIAADGSFDGVVVVSLDPQYLSKFYDSVDLGNRGVVTLTGTDGIVRARAAAGNTDIGQSLGGGRLLAEFARSPFGNFESVSTVDHVARVYAYRSVRSYPLIVSVGLARRDLLAVVDHNRGLYLLLGAILTALLLGASLMILRRDAGLREAREKLRLSEAGYAQKSALLEATLENMSQGIMMVDADRRVQVCNRRAIEKLGLPPDLMARHPLFDEVLRWQWRQGEFGRDGNKLEGSLREFVLAGGISDEPQRYERTRPNGQVLEFRSMPLADGGVVRTYTDITQRKETERGLRAARDTADRAAREKADFLAMMSHEIRSPMNGLLGIIELLHNTRLEPDQAYMVELAQESASALLGIVNDVLDLSKIDAGAVVPSSEPTAIRELLRELIKPFTLTGARKDLSLRYELSDKVPEWIAVDPLRLRQILGNLLGNAVKFTGARGLVELTVSRAGNGLAFSVRDTGIGMTAEVLDRLFQPFSQADASTTRNFGGTGLGLSISRRLARLLGGDIAVTSKPAEGSVFTLTLPLVESDPAPDRIISTPTPFVPEALRQVRVLVAEDLETNRWVIQRQFARIGITAEVVEDGHQALAALAEGRFELLVTDCHMPGMDGAELTMRIRAAEVASGTARLPILGLTADVTAEMRNRCLAAGMDEITSKPIDLSRLAAVLARVISSPGRATPTLEATQSMTDDQLFDDSTYSDLFGNDGGVGVTWLEGYIATTETALDRVHNAIEADDRVALLTAVHTLAGASLTAGAMRVGGLAAAFESAAPSAGQSELRQRSAELQAAFQATCAALKGFIETRSTRLA